MHDDNEEHLQATVTDGTVLVQDLLQKCRALLSQLEQFQTFLAERQKEHSIEIRQFYGFVLSELRSLEKLSQSDPTSDRTLHTLRSSNLPFYVAVWSAAKRTSGFVTFSKRFYWDTPPSRSSKLAGKAKKRCALVDIVAKDGLEWIKVSTITESRLLFEKAKAGWEEGDSSDDDGSAAHEDGKLVNGLGTRMEEGNQEHKDSDSDDRVELIKVAEDLRRASRTVKIRYKHPTVLFVLPKVTLGHISAIDAIIDEIRATGALVQTSSDLSSTQEFPNGNSTPNGISTTNGASLFDHLLPSPHPPLTQTLNLDCTFLLALVSDLSHGYLPTSPQLNKFILRQISLETSVQLLPSSLYPAIAGRSLVCTEEAVIRMREIVSTIGTAAEKLRTSILLAEDAYSSLSPSALVTAWSQHSTYPTPSTIHLPITIVTLASAVPQLALLPQHVRQKVEAELSPINRSVFMYGWAMGVTTLSSNRAVAREVERIVGGEGEVGPEVWLCTPRSLVGKERGRRG